MKELDEKQSTRRTGFNQTLQTYIFHGIEHIPYYALKHLRDLIVKITYIGRLK